MNTSRFADVDITDDKIEILDITGATSETFKRRMSGGLYFMKKLRSEYAGDKRYRQAFYKEFLMGKDIVSPYVVKYVAINNDADGLYILMKYVNGDSLEKKLSQEPEYFHKKKNIKKLLMQLSQALTELHKRGIVHLDVKPENILLTKTTNDVVLIDLGFCISNSYDNTAGCTAHFAAPEALAGNIGEIDARSDIYSVGRLLEYIEKKCGRSLPRLFGKIKDKCLQKQKSRRYSSAKEVYEVAADVKRWCYAACFVLAMLLGFCLFSESPLYNKVSDYICWRLGNVPDRFEKDGIFYHITDGDARTVEVTFKGNTPDEFEYEYKGGEVKIPLSVTYYSRDFAVTAIAGQAFKTPYISKVNIPEGIKIVKDSALFGCLLNGVIRIPKSIEYFGVSNIFPTSYIDSIVVHKDNPYYDSRDNCNAIIETKSNILITGCKNSVIPYGIEHIAKNAFFCADRLKHITIPPTVKSIGEAAFVESRITEIEIPEGITTLERYTFQYCGNLQKVTLPQSLTTIKHAALSHCGFYEIVIPDSVTFIGDYAFDWCELLKTLTIGKGVRHIGYAAFDSCRRLCKVVSHIPADSLFELDSSVFNNIGDDCVLYVPRGAKDVYMNTFGWNKFNKIIELSN